MNFKKNLSKRGLALLIALVMTLSLLPTAVFAEELEDAGAKLETGADIQATPVPAGNTGIQPIAADGKNDDDANQSEPVVNTTPTVTSADELKAALENADVTEITLDNDIDMTDVDWSGVEIDSGRTLVINGGGHTISNMVVNQGAKTPNGTGVIGDGGSCDYYAGFIANNKGTLTIQDLTFTAATVDIDPLTVNEKSTGSSILAVVCANNTGTLRYVDVAVKDSTVKGYTKVGLLHGYTQKGGSFVAERCTVTGSTVELEADGTGPVPLFGGVLIGYAPGGRSTTKGISMENNNMVISEAILEKIQELGYGLYTREDGSHYISDNTGRNYSLTATIYSAGGADSVSFAAETDGFQYETLQDAINATESGEITLLRDVTENVTIAKDQDITLDLNGKTLVDSTVEQTESGSQKADRHDTIVNNGTLTITGPGTVDNVSHGVSALENNGTAVLTGCTIARSKETGISNKISGGNSYYFIENYGTMTLTDVTAQSTGKFSSMVRNGATDKSGNIIHEATLTINSGTLINGNTAVKNECGNLTINDGVIVSLTSGYSVVNQQGTTELKGGDYTGSDEYAIHNDTTLKRPVIVSGGKFGASNVSAYVVPGMMQAEDGSIVINEASAVAKVNGIGYTSLQDAIDTTESGEITLLKDVTENVTIAEGKDITLDLAGKTLNGNFTTNHVLTNNGTLVIEDSVGNGKITRDESSIEGTSKEAHKNHGYIILNAGTLTLNGGTIEGNCLREKNPPSTICNGPEKANIVGKLTINAGATVYAELGIAVKNDENGTLEMTGGTVTANSAKHGHHYAAVQNWTENATISGGEINGDVETWTYGSTTATTKLSGSVVVHGGVYTEKFNDKTTNTPKTEITGGTYSSEVGGSYIDTAAYHCVTSGEMYTVAEHSHDTIAAVPATCTTTGLTAGEKCNTCDYVFTAQTEIPVTAHTPAEAVREKEVAATCTAEGSYDEVVYCSVCNEELSRETMTIAKAAHTPGEAVRENEVAATCAAAGSYNEVVKCSVCQAEISREAKTTEALGHAFAEDWTSDGTNHWHVCTRCNETSGSAAHTWNAGEVTTEATYTAPGVRTFTCTVCRATRTEEIPQLTRPSSGGGTRQPTTVIDDPETPLADAPFEDVLPNDWSFSAVSQVYNRKIMQGVTETEFAPAMRITRGMIITMLHRMDEKPDAAPSSFSDVPAGQWYTNSVNWGAANQILSGYSDGTCKPGQAITRQELASILYRYASFKGYDTAKRADLDKFADAGDVGTWAAEAMRWAVAQGLISGKTETTLDPTGFASRAEAASIFARFLNTFEAKAE